VAVEQRLSGSGERKVMLEKLLLAVTITFSLNLFLGVRLPSTNQTTSSFALVDKKTTLVSLLKKERAFLTTINREENIQRFLPSEPAPPNVQCFRRCLFD
jgi:uncharacterized membrane protein